MNTQIGGLTSLRGIAALIVVVFHFAYYTLPSTGVVLSAYSNFFRNGYLAVDLFFMLSGFIMAYVYVDQFSNGVSKSNYREYLRSRFARIYPLHLFTLATLVCLEIVKIFLPNFHAFTGTFTFRSLFANIFLLQVFDLNSPPLLWGKTYWNEPAWSISVEFVIYFLFPFVLFSLLKTKPRIDSIVYLMALALLLLLIKFTTGTLSTIIGIPSIARCGLECVLGIITYKVYRSNQYQKYLKLDSIAIVTAIVIAAIMHIWVDRPHGLYDWLTLPAFSILILALANNRSGLIFKLMNSSLLLYLGTISYSIYMVHWCLAEFLKTFWLYKFQIVFGSDFTGDRSLIALGLFIPIVLLTASLTYQFVEVPMRKLLKPKSRVLV
jgi:peptidoglycan/LPS O-acetylase OafA/YrhL